MKYCTCVCKFDEAEDNVIQWCATHNLALTNAIEAERDECAKIADKHGSTPGRELAEIIRARR